MSFDKGGIVTPSVPAATPSLSVLPSMKIVMTDEPLSPDEALLLGAYAERVNEAEWYLNQARTMQAIENGHQVAELREFLQTRDEQPLPETVERFITDAEKNSRLLHDSGTARLIECADAALAELFATDERTKHHCLRAGDHHLVVSAKSEAHFRKALHLLGYCIKSSDQ